MEVACGEHGDVLHNLVSAVEFGQCALYDSHEKTHKENVANGDTPASK